MSGSRQHQVDVNLYGSLLSMFVLVVALAGSADAVAADMGATSRESVSISVTVPPHVVVTSTNVRLEGSQTSPALCVATNGFTQYHVAMIRHSGSVQDEEISTEGEGRSDRSVCPGAVPVVPQVLAGMEGSSSEALTLLIVPD